MDLPTTTKAQKAFCSKVDRLEADKKRLDAELTHAPPGAGDTQASWLSDVTGWSAKTSGSVLSVVTAIILEFAAAWMLLAADTTPWPTWPTMVEPDVATKVEPKLESEKPRRRRRRKVKKPDQRKLDLSAPRPSLTLIPGDRL